MKKTALLILLIFLVISCGKKGDPVYKESKKKSNLQSIFLYRALV